MILSRKYGIAIIMAVIIFIPNVCAIKMSVSSGNGISYSGYYRMDTSTSLKDDILLSGEGIFQDTTACGTGKNAIIKSIGGNGYNGESSLLTSGSFSTSSSSVVTNNAGMMSQDVSAEGDASIAASASAATGTAVQQASVNSGALSSSQILAMGSSAFAGQNVAIAGDSGTIDSATLSPGDRGETVNAYFIGGGNLDAQLASISGQESGMRGTASFNGMEVVNDGILQELDSGEVEMAVDGLYQSQRGSIGAFGLIATSTASSRAASTQSAAPLPTVQVQGAITKEGSHPEIVDAPLGNANSNKIWGIKIKTPIQLYLRADSNLKAEGLDAVNVASEVSSAANTWDYWTKPNQNNLFQPKVTIDAAKVSDRKDGYNVVSFIPMSQSYLAYTRTWFSGSSLSEADMCFNMNYQWTTDWSAAKNGVYDVQAVALHELGHYVGLGDLYNLPTSDPRQSDKNQQMNSINGINGPRHSLGAGDIAGVRQIYGA